MRATTVMLLGIGAALVGRWSHNQPTVPSAAGVVEVTFALIVIAAMDGGKTEPIAKGFAWLFLAAVLLSNNSPLTGIAKAANPAPTPKAPPKKGK